jgi:hypothetical protein
VQQVTPVLPLRPQLLPDSLRYRSQGEVAVLVAVEAEAGAQEEGVVEAALLNRLSQLPQQPLLFALTQQQLALKLRRKPRKLRSVLKRRSELLKRGA